MIPEFHGSVSIPVMRCPVHTGINPVGTASGDPPLMKKHGLEWPVAPGLKIVVVGFSEWVLVWELGYLVFLVHL
jgi:hypothetical protein